MKKMKRLVVVLLSLAMATGSAVTTMAGEWQQNNTGWWYDYGDGTYPANGWHWLDGDGDGIAERYHFDSNGYILISNKAPDGNTVNENGEWTVNGVVQQGTTTAMERAQLIQTTVAQGAAQHNYYKNISRDKADQADLSAQIIAREILDTPTFDTDYKRISAAASVVAYCCSNCEYGSDDAYYYRSPYGVFKAGVFTCAGSARALGRILDYMGYTWQHTNENQNSHQWCIVTMDGQIGWADGMAGVAGFGDANDPSTGLSSKGFIMY